MKDDVLYVNGKAYKEDYVNRQTDDPNQLRITENFTLEQLVNEKKCQRACILCLVTIA